MNKILIALTALLAIGCVGSGGSSERATSISEAIIGTWEIDSMSFNGQSMKPNRPDPSDPYAERNASEWTQLKIDEKTLTLISTDFVHFSEPQLPYKVEDNKVITIDENNFSMTDFVVIDYSKDSLTLEFISEGNTPKGMYRVFKRINEDQLATKTAKSVDFEQSVKVTVEREGNTDLQLDKKTKGLINYKKDGLHDSISCSLDYDNKKLLLYSQVLEIEGNSLNSNSDRDGVSFNFKGLDLDLQGPNKSLNSNSEVAIGVTTEAGKIYENISNCTNSIDRNGAALQIISNCTSDDGKLKVSLESTCLLQHSEW